MEQKLRMFGVWCGIGHIIVFFIAFVPLLHWIPPLSPALGAEEIWKIFQTRSVPIRVGMVFLSLGSVLYLPWTVLIADLMREREGKSFFLSGTQLATGIIATTTFFIPSFFWTAAAFRTETSPELTLILSDSAFLFFLLGIGPYIMQYTILAIFTLSDKSQPPLFPRWVAYFQMMLAISFLPAVFAFFMKTGPFAWDGLFVWWIPLVLFSVWYIIMIWACRNAVLRMDQE